MSRALASGPSPTIAVRMAQVALYAALGGVAYLANGHMVRLSSGADILPGTIFGILAAAIGGPWIGMAVAGLGALGTAEAFRHAWVVLIVVPEAGLIGFRARRGRTPVSSSLLYWLFLGSPIVAGIYSWHLGVRGEHLGMIWLADFLSSLAGAVVSHIVISLTPDLVTEWLGISKPHYSLREHIWVGALAFGMAPLLFLLRYAGGDLQAIREREVREHLLNLADDFAAHLEADAPDGFRIAQIRQLDSGEVRVSWQRGEAPADADLYEVRFQAAQWIRRRSHVRELSLYCFRADGELLFRIPGDQPAEITSLLQPFAREHGTGTTAFRLQSKNPFQRPLQIAGKVDKTARDLVVVAAQPFEAANAAGRLVREVSLRWISGSILMSLLFGLLFSMRLTQKLRRLMESMDRALREDGMLGPCPAGASPEVQLLWGGFQQLQGRLGAALADQRKTAERATAAVREKSLFLAAVSHEIRGPMTRMLGAATLMRLKDSSLAPADGLPMIQRAGEHVMSILEDVTDFCTLELEKMPIRRAPFPLPAALAEVLQWVEEEARGKDIEFGLFLAADAPIRINTDRTRLTQVLYNVLQNAVKFTDRGAVRVEVRGGRRSAESGMSEVEFRVVDTGDGIPAEWQAQVFEPFFHRTRPLASPRSGSGLGLAIVRGLTHAMHGRVALESKLGEGTSFTVRLPIGEDRTGKEPLREHLGADAYFAMRPSISREALISQWAYLGLRYRTGELGELPAAAEGEGPHMAFIELEELAGDVNGITERMRSAGIRNAVAVETSPRPQWVPLPDDVNGVHIQWLRWPLCLFQLPEAMQAILLTEASTAGAKEGPGAGPRPLRILAAEDDADSRMLLELALRKLGHAVVTVGNGHEAIEALRSRPFDAVMLDIEMPELNGLQALALIRRNPATAQLPVVAVTAHTSETQRTEFLAAGFTGYVAKPYTLESLAETLRIDGGRKERPSDAGPVDTRIFGQYADLLRGAGRDLDGMVNRILGEVGRWLEGTPRPEEVAGMAAHTLAGSCSLIGARKLAGVLRELSAMAKTENAPRWNAGLAEAGAALRETEAYFEEAKAERE